MAIISNLHLSIYVVVFLVGNVLSQCLFKIGVQNINGSINISFFSFSTLAIGGGVILQVFGLCSWLLILRYKDLSWAGLMAALIPVLLVLTGKYVFGENVDNLTILGVFMVISGLIVVNHSSISSSIT
ncbi:MAG: hypothetical protein GQ532_05905 [Methylomarinum sp.]|nr:hypothetical protein [Methylomarinum sp.]